MGVKTDPQSGARPALPPLPEIGFDWTEKVSPRENLPLVSDSQVIPLPTSRGLMSALRPLPGGAMPSPWAFFLSSLLSAFLAAVIVTCTTPGATERLESLVGALSWEESTAQTRIYIVKAGDTLSSIAKRELGDAGLWRLLYHTNREQLASPAELEVGTELELPIMRVLR